MLADRLPLRVHRVRQQWLQMEGGCPKSVGGVLWTTRPGEREGMQYVDTFHFTERYQLFVLFTLVSLLSSVTDVLSILKLVLPLQSFLPLGAVERGLSLQCSCIAPYLLQVPLYANSQTRQVCYNTP